MEIKGIDGSVMKIELEYLENEAKNCVAHDIIIQTTSTVDMTKYTAKHSNNAHQLHRELLQSTAYLYFKFKVGKGNIIVDCMQIESIRPSSTELMDG